MAMGCVMEFDSLDGNYETLRFMITEKSENSIEQYVCFAFFISLSPPAGRLREATRGVTHNCCVIEITFLVVPVTHRLSFCITCGLTIIFALPQSLCAFSSR